jgi:hypothetical protein
MCVKQHDVDVERLAGCTYDRGRNDVIVATIGNRGEARDAVNVTSEAVEGWTQFAVDVRNRSGLCDEDTVTAAASENFTKPFERTERPRLHGSLIGVQGILAAHQCVHASRKEHATVATQDNGFGRFNRAPIVLWGRCQQRKRDTVVASVEVDVRLDDSLNGHVGGLHAGAVCGHVLFEDLGDPNSRHLLEQQDGQLSLRSHPVTFIGQVAAKAQAKRYFRRFLRVLGFAITSVFLAAMTRRNPSANRSAARSGSSARTSGTSAPELRVAFFSTFAAPVSRSGWYRSGACR